MNADQEPAPSGSLPLSSQPLSKPPAPGVHKVPGKPEDPVVEVVHEVTDQEVPPDEEPGGIHETVKTLLVGRALSLDDKKVFSHISLIALFAWVGLGADGLSSSCYGPEEAFKALRENGVDHTSLALFLAIATVFTVVVISWCYIHIISVFPSGGGGYLVASKMLGDKVGALSGCALIVDYILTVTVSIAAAGDALFGLPLMDNLGQFKLVFETGAIVFLVVLNLRGVKESIYVLLPIFLVFLICHAILITGVLGTHAGEIGKRSKEIADSLDGSIQALGWVGVMSLFLRAFAHGAGTYTGIEAVSNSMAVMREPRVATGQRTMIYMAISLAITAGGLILAYLLIGLTPGGGTQTMNHRLVESFVEGLPLEPWSRATFVWITVLSEAALLIVAAQAGFIGGPKCLANMAHDSWVPHWFGSLSERLASHNGILLIGSAAAAALWSTGGKTTELVTMYSINVFVTFTLSMLGMCVYWYGLREKNPLWKWRLALFTFGAVLCGTILVIVVVFKFSEGAWKTVVVTGLITGLSLLIRRYYKSVTKRLKSLNESLGTIEIKSEPTKAPLRPQEPTAAILVGGYSGIGVHTLLNSLRFVPHHFKNIVFLSVGVVDSGNFKGAEAVDDLRKFTEEALEKYVDLARRMGLPARAYMTIGTDVVEELDQLCRVVAKDFPRVTVFAGQLVFQKETWYGPILHNQTAYSLQRRLQWDGIPMVILPTRVKDA
ncbi:MAG: amino acid permease [Pirellulaceae bacterium]|nr:amino acid permease [Pirellulaceae bacterium]